MSLPHDVERCSGIGSESDGWHEECETCLRRTSPGGQNTPHREPPQIIVFSCPLVIEP